MKASAATSFSCVFFFLSSILFAQTTPNSDGNYQQLRNIGLQSGSITVENLRFKRDSATFLLNAGTLCFVAPVNNKVTGAVFVGDGKLLLDPPIASERTSLSVFTNLVLRFTDNTYEELKSAGKP